MSMLVDQMMKGTDDRGRQPLYGGLMTQKLGDQLAAPAASAWPSARASARRCP